LAVDSVNRQHESEIAALKQRYDTLTRRENEVMSLVVTGMLNKQTSEIAVKVHRAWVMHKMQAESLSELVRMAEELHLSAPIYGGQDRFQRRCGSSAKIDGPGRLNSLANRYGLRPVG